MKRLLRNLLKLLAYAGAVLVILLAVAVGLFRLFLPRLPEYQDDIKSWASAAIGMEVEFSGMDARWGLSGPQLEFYDAELVRPASGKRVVAAGVVGVGIAIDRLVLDWEFTVNRILIRDTALEVRRLPDGEWWVQGSPPEELFTRRTSAPQQTQAMEFVGEDIEIRFLRPGDERPQFFHVTGVHVSSDAKRIAADAEVRLPEELGRWLEMSATRLLDVPEAERAWDLLVEVDDLRLAEWFELLLGETRGIADGGGDVSVSLALTDDGVRSAAAEVEFQDVLPAAGEPFDLAGRFELDVSADGWLAAAERLRIRTDEHEWPSASLRAEAGTDADGTVVMLDMRASYLRLDDARLLLPWFPEAPRQRWLEVSPTGVIRNLDATLSDLDSDKPQYDISAELERAGFAAAATRPGVSNFTGLLRANRAGGRLEIDAPGLQLDLQRFLDDPVDLDSAFGTVLWRNSEGRTTVLSDSIRLANPVFDLSSNVQLTLYADGRAPEVDLLGNWSVSDIAMARRYIPRKVIKPRLYNWFQNSFQGGSITRGTIRLNGALDKFPFDQGGGRFLLEGSARNLTFKYQPKWPAADRADMEIVLDNTRLYSVRNRSLNAGNQTVNALVEIADLRNPVLRIEALLTGTLETMRDFALQSPLNGFVGGNLDRIKMSGDATFQLDLTVPLRRAVDTTVTGVLRSNNGQLAIDGFAPPVTDLIGEVTITREQVSSEVLGATFLGQPVAIRLGPSEDARYFAEARVSGMATAEGLVEELGLPLADLVEGASSYEARLLFPRGGQPARQPFTIELESALDGLGIGLPEPFGKTSDQAVQVRGNLRFLPDGEGLETLGFTENRIAWRLGFKPADGVLDFDRGVVTLGGDVMEPAETRGLHVRGETSTVRLDDWLNLSRGGGKAGLAERVRSIDVHVDNLFAVGQHLEDHHVRVDRSARDWLVQVEGDDVTGSIFVPYDFTAERAMTIEATRLRLPGDEVTPPSEAHVDPRKLPPIRLKAAEFALGDRYLGTVEAVVDRVAGGLEATMLSGRDATFSVNATGRWVVDEAGESGSRTYVSGTLESGDVDATMKRLDYAPGITAKKMNIVFDVNWDGGPRADFVDALDGNVDLRIEDGQVEEVEPGAGRMFGLLSFVALPRRLSLDFRDVFNRGFGFDSIAGNFRLVDGAAFTCDLSMEGPAANIGIVGRADLAGRVYEQAAVISANVGNTLPIVGAVVGGPPGAAAMLIFSQIFRKPLQEVGQVYYGISGSWDDPAIETANSDEFVRHGQLAGCLADMEE